MKPYHRSKGITLHQGDSLSVLRTMADQSVQMCVTSPPYWLAISIAILWSRRKHHHL